MPNSLVHFAVQGVATRSMIRDADIKWVFLGCIIPDIPWIIQRVLRVMLPQIDPYTLRVYVIIQASFVFCVILSAAFAFFSEKPKTVFLILLLNSFVHLLLDALEIKPGAGVHLIAPFSWELIMFGLVWPEHVAVALLTIIGLIYAMSFVLMGIRSQIRLSAFSTRSILLSSILLILYCHLYCLMDR